MQGTAQIRGRVDDWRVSTATFTEDGGADLTAAWTDDPATHIAAVQSSNTRLEVQFGKAMWAAGIRYRKQYPPSNRQARFCTSSLKDRGFLRQPFLAWLQMD